MLRPRRRQAPASRTAIETGWRWRTFPVFFAFVSGIFVMGLSITLGEGVFGTLFLASLAGMGFGLAHILTRWIAVRRAQRLSQQPDVASPEEVPEETPISPRRRRRRRR